MSVAYYGGWAKEIAEHGPLSPGVYFPNNLYLAQWSNLAAAITSGAPCKYIWVAWYDQVADGYADYELVDPAKQAKRTPPPPSFSAQLASLVVGRQYIGDAYLHRFYFTAFYP